MTAFPDLYPPDAPPAGELYRWACNASFFRLWEQQMRTSLIRLVVAAMAATSFAYGMSGLAQDLPAGVKVITPTEIKWEESSRGQNSTLAGDPRKPGAYVTRSKWPPNTVNPPHYHPESEEITVISGTWYIGEGLTMDPEKAIALPAGSFVVVNAKTWHYFLTKSDPAEVEFWGMGPRTNIYAK